MTIGRNIRRIRELRNFTQLHMSECLGMTQSGYSKLESDDADILFSRIIEISKILKVSPETIIGFDEKIVFHMVDNKTANGIVFNNQISPNEKRLYDEVISVLKEEVTYLRRKLDECAKKQT